MEYHRTEEKDTPSRDSNHAPSAYRADALPLYQKGHRWATRGQLVAIATPNKLLAAYTYSQNTLKNTMLERVVKVFSQS
jgi:hypothetical protein